MVHPKTGSTKRAAHPARLHGISRLLALLVVVKQVLNRQAPCQLLKASREVRKPAASTLESNPKNTTWLATEASARAGSGLHFCDNKQKRASRRQTAHIKRGFPEVSQRFDELRVIPPPWIPFGASSLCWRDAALQLRSAWRSGAQVGKSVLKGAERKNGWKKQLRQIVEARGYKPWSPDAVMTTRGVNKSVLRLFKGS